MPPGPAGKEEMSDKLHVKEYSLEDSFDQGACWVTTAQHNVGGSGTL